jgi:thiol-disulfide isomerase/thioredoxin
MIATYLFGGFAAFQTRSGMINKHLLAALLVLGVIFALPLPTLHAQETKDTVNVYFFWGEGCPHCAKEKPFLEQLQLKYPQVRVQSYEIWKNAENREMLVEFGKRLNATVNGVPFTVVGEKYVVGWMDESTTGAQIEDAVRCAIESGCRDVGLELSNDPSEVPVRENAIPETITLPILGEVRTKTLSLPVFTIIIAALDGFNPCAMWTLVFLIGLLLGMKDRKRMWLLGTAFIMASAGVYFLFLSAWLNLLLFIGFILWVRLGIGVVALGGGGYYLKEYFLNPHGTCKVTGGTQRQKVFARLKALTHESHFLIALVGIILLAVAVNLVELICSAGLPAVYTQVLTLSHLPTWQYYLYLLLYILIFMLDDLVVFFSAMITLQMTGLSDKYARASHLIGGTLMVLIGLLLLFKPEWLMFG